MSRDRRPPRDRHEADDEATAIRPRDDLVDERVPAVSFDPKGAIPKLPAAFRGRRRFSVRAEPEPEPIEDPIARARAWEPVEAEPAVANVRVEDTLYSDDANALVREGPAANPWPYAHEAIKRFRSEPSIPTPELIEETGDSSDGGDVVIGVNGVTPREGEASRTERSPGEGAYAGSEQLLPRLPVAGALPLMTGLEIPAPSEARWPTETPPPSSSMFAHGAEDSLQPSVGLPEAFESADAPRLMAKPVSDRLSVDFASHAKLAGPTADERFGHTLQPKESVKGLVDGWPTPPEPRSPPPRPSVDAGAPVMLRPRPEVPSDAPRTPMTEQPVPSPLRNPSAYEDESSSIDIDDPVGFEPAPESDEDDDAPVAQRRVATMAALGCFGAFAALVAAAAIGFATALALQ